MSNRTSMMRVFQAELRRPGPNEPSTVALDPPDRRLHYAALLLEETLEAIEALGCRVAPVGHIAGGEHARSVSVGGFTAAIGVNTDSFDLESAIHEVGDVSIVAEDTFVMLGVQDSDPVFEELWRSALSKILPDGSLIRHPVRTHDNRYRRPDIAGVITRQRAAASDDLT